MNPTLNKSILKNKLDHWIAEIQGGQIYLTCSKHGYVARRSGTRGDGGLIPPQPRGCPDCWRCYFVADYCLNNPETRYEQLQQLDEVIHHTVEFAKKGKFGADFELYEPGDPRFQIKIESNAE
jgi:hypothetical protein